MKITALCENTSRHSDIECEHGLSLYIETQNEKILFDMGQSDLFCRNAKKLGVDLSLVDLALISHGHYDHGGGFSAFRKLNPTAPVFVSPRAFGQFYSTKYIGLAPAVSQDPHLVLTSEDLTPIDGIYILTGDKIQPETWQNRGLFKMENGVCRPDDFCHEIYLMVREAGKNVLFCGCAHRGVLSIIRHFSPDVLVGGFHFKNLLPEKDTDRALLLAAVKQLGHGCTDYYTCHCTGAEPYAFLHSQLPEKLHYLACGDCIVL